MKRKKSRAEAGRIEVSIILFNDNSPRCVQTLESIWEQSLYQAKGCQLILIECAETQPDAEYKESVGKFQHNFIRIAENGPNSGFLLEKALEKVEGEYVTISKAGVVYLENVLEKIMVCLQKKGARAGVISIGGGKKTAEIRELNAYAREYGEDTDLRNNYHLVHCNYAAYFIHKDVMTSRKTVGEDWTLTVLRKIFYTVVQEEDLYKIPKGRIRYEDDVQLLANPWRTMMKEQRYEEFWNGFLKHLLSFAKEYTGDARKNVEYNLLYYCRRMQGLLLEMEEDKRSQLRAHVDEVFGYLKDTEVLLVNQYFSRTYKNFLLKNYVWEEVHEKDLADRKEDILNEENAPNELQFITLLEDKLVLEGKTELYTEAPYEVYVVANGENHLCQRSAKEGFSNWFGENINHVAYYRCEIPLEKGKKYQFQIACVRDEETIRKENLSFGAFFPLSREVALFVQRSGWLMSYDSKKQMLCLAPDKFMQRCMLKLRRTGSLLTENNAARKALLARTIHKIRLKWKKKQVWLVSDRVNRGDDNGESFFRYLSEHPQEDVDAYYVIDKECPDYERMKQYGKVIPVYSWKHKIYHLLSDYVISSQANKPVMNPFGKIGMYYKDMIAEKPIVFLQHGVIKDDLSGWLNRYNRNLYGFVTTTRAEYQSILDYEYYYTPREVWMTGLPRHDYLVHDEKGYITIMPTWRKTLTGGTNSAGEWIIGSDFEKSGFFKFYDQLLNHQRLIEAAKKYGYKICFFPHPNVKPALPLFHHHKDVVFWDMDKPYREVYAESNLILTDYSSAVFDFAYLRKPIVYCQFDRKEFFSGGHSYVEGYYNYQTDGFGEVEENLEDTVTRLIEYMENGCQLKPEYRKRIDDTFAYSDKNCCERVWKKIRNREEN